MMRPLLALLTVPWGCGRLAFDATTDAAAPVGMFSAGRVVSGLSSPVDDEEDPSLTADMLEIVFARNSVLMTATRNALGAPWTTPTQIAALDSGDETSPELSPDGLVIFFTSFRADAAGDIYISQRASRTAPWSPPQPVSSLNTTAYDLSVTTTIDLRSAV